MTSRSTRAASAADHHDTLPDNTSAEQHGVTSTDEVAASHSEDHSDTNPIRKGSARRGRRESRSANKAEDDPANSVSAEPEQQHDASSSNAEAPIIPKIEHEDEDAPTSAANSIAIASEDVKEDVQDSSRDSAGRSTRELSRLGLASLGDGDESLPPRRSRRGAHTSPSVEAKPDLIANGEDGDQGYGASAGHEGDDGAEEESMYPSSSALPDIDRDEEDGEGDVEGVTRCVCGSEDENVGLMIQCEICKCWQHCVCMGMNTEEECPDVYYCEQCKPELHIDLLRALGFLPQAKSHKKGVNRYHGKNPAKEAAKELQAAREAVNQLAKANAQRRKEGKEPVVANNAPLAAGRRQGTERRTTSESRDADSKVPASPSKTYPSQDPHSSGRRSPKRRSTMNSRDSGLGGWEAIPPGLLNEDEVWDDGRPRDEDEAAQLRKRKRGGRNHEDGSPSPAGSPTMPSVDQGKRRRMSGSGPATSGRDLRRRSSSAEEEDGAASSANGASSRRGNGKIPPVIAGKGGRNSSVAEEITPAAASTSAVAPPGGKAKQPNQYTYRKEKAEAAATSGGKPNIRGPSPTPSPSKHGRRGAPTLREGSVLTGAGSRTGTPAPGERPTRGGNNHQWGMPEHASQWSYLLPTVAPELLTYMQPSSKSTTTHRTVGASEAAETGAKPSAQPYVMVEVTEPPTKVRWPGKRTTMGEMKKRVKTISDALTRMEMEAVDRKKRCETLGIVTKTSLRRAEKDAAPSISANGAGPTDPASMEGIESTSHDSAGAAVDGSAASATISAIGTPHGGDDAAPTSNGSTGPATPLATASTLEELDSLDLLHDLQKQIHSFQSRFAGTAAATAAFPNSALPGTSGLGLIVATHTDAEGHEVASSGGTAATNAA